ncbi:CPSF4 factor, partial [Cochlearius cochlearius]|nr:CPSF4 factor [Cochlearius cochlearius]
MQELVAGVEKIRFDLEADVEQQRGAQPLPFPGMDKLGAAVCEFFHRGLCTKGECWEGAGMGLTPPCKILGLPGRRIGPLSTQPMSGDGCDFLHEYDATKMPECYFYSKFGECSNKDCPFLHIDATTRTMGCPWYDRGFCRHGGVVLCPHKRERLLCTAGPLCKYKHTQRVLCANYLVGFCPEGPKCKFMQYLLLLPQLLWDSNCQLPLLFPQGAGRAWGLARLDLAAGGESGCKDVTPTEAPLPVPGATQHLMAQLRDTSSCPPGTQSLLERGICFKCGQRGHYASKCGKTQLEILLGK